MLKNILSLPLLLVFVCANVCGQTVVHNVNEQMAIEAGTFMSINGDLILSNDAEIHNQDSILLNGDFENNGNGGAFTKTGAGWLHLNGADQTIKGSSVSTFHHLNLIGTDDKTATIDAEVYGDLYLHNKVFHVDSHTVSIYNPNTDAVKFDSGYVNSTYTGGLARTTNTAALYYYPLGDGVVYRPAAVTPSDASPNMVKLSLIGTSADNDGYRFTDKDGNICELNDQFYHEYTHDSGIADMTVSIVFDPIVDDNVNDAAYWQMANWNNYDVTSINNSVSFTPFGAYASADSEDFYMGNQMIPIDLAASTSTIADAGESDTILRGSRVTLGGPNNTVYDAEGSLFDWTPSQGLDNSNGPNPSVTLSADESYIMRITTPEGCELIDTVTFIVLNRPGGTIDDFLCPEIPDGITPNNDGFNEVWNVDCLSNFPDHSVVVFNRWGEEVYGPVDDYYNLSQDDKFDGRWKNKQLPEGTYYYIIRLRINAEEEEVLDGPLTIVR